MRIKTRVVKKGKPNDSRDKFEGTTHQFYNPNVLLFEKELSKFLR